MPVILSTPAQNGAQIVSLCCEDAQPRSPTPSMDRRRPHQSPIYEAPFLVASNLTVKAIATAADDAPKGSVVSQAFAPNIPSGALVWSDEFTNDTAANAQPDPKIWTYDVGHSRFVIRGTGEFTVQQDRMPLPVQPPDPDKFVGADSSLHVNGPAAFTRRLRLERDSRRKGLFSVQYGRIEFRARVPEAQGFWPAAWLLGNNIATIDWPACGEQDVLERVNAAKTPDWNERLDPRSRFYSAATAWAQSSTFPPDRPRRIGTTTA